MVSAFDICLGPLPQIVQKKLWSGCELAGFCCLCQDHEQQQVFLWEATLPAFLVPHETQAHSCINIFVFFFFNRGLLILKSSICCCLGPVCQFGGSTTDFFLGCFCAVRPQPMRNSLCHTDLLWLLFLLFSLPRMERKIPKMELSSSQHHHLHHHNRRASWLWCQFSAPAVDYVP